MRFVSNTGTDRVIDLVRQGLTPGHQLDVVTPTISLFAFAEVIREAAKLSRCRLIMPPANAELGILGSPADRPARNRLQARWLAMRLVQWIHGKAEVRRAMGQVPQGSFVLRDENARPMQVFLGSLAFSTDGFGLTPGNPMSLIQASETSEEAALLSQWFDVQWSGLAADAGAKAALIEMLQSLASQRAPSLVYTLILRHLFRNRGDDLDEERIVKSETGIRKTVVWKKLYKFQRDGVVLRLFPQAKQILDRLKRVCVGRDLPDAAACTRFDKATKQGEDMLHAQRLLAAAVASVVGKTEERAIASLFTPGGTHALKGEFAGSNDFEVVAFLVILPGTPDNNREPPTGSEAAK